MRINYSLLIFINYKKKTKSFYNINFTINLTTYYR